MKIVLTSYDGIFINAESGKGLEGCLPAEGNLKFFRALYQQLKETHRVKSPLGIVTVMNSNRKGGLREQLNNYDWGTFPEFPTELGQYSLFRRRFSNIECVGDLRGPAYINNSPGGIRSSAYRALCERLSVMPDKTIIETIITRVLYGGGRLNLKPSQTITFEATAEGIRAANSAGIKCVGVKAEGSKQDLSEAAVVVEGTLENIIGAVPAIAYSSPMDALDSIAKTRSNIYWTYGEKMLENRLSTQPVKENEPVLLIYDKTLILFRMPKERNIGITTEDCGDNVPHHYLCLKVNSPVYEINLGYHLQERSQKANLELSSFLIGRPAPPPYRCAFDKPAKTENVFLTTSVCLGAYAGKYDTFQSIIVFGGKAIRSVVEESEIFYRYKEYLPLAQPLVEKFLDERTETRLR